MSGGLAEVVAALGGDLWDGGLRANVPAPGHSRKDRSVSLRLVDDRLLIHTFGDGDWRTVRDDLLRRGLIAADGRIGAIAPSRPTLSPAMRVRAAERLWSRLAPLRPDEPASRHLRRRAVTADPTRLTALRGGSAPLSVYADAGRQRPVLAAAITIRGRLTGLELTYLHADGRRASDLRLPRKTVGVLPSGCAVDLSGAAATRLVVGEGVFTVLSAMARFDRPGIATLAAHNLARWRPPSEARDVLIAADPGRVGETAATTLADRLAPAGVCVRIALPEPGYEDWNAEAMAAARACP